MRPILRHLLAVPAALLVAACGRATDADSQLSADLERDLELAKSKSVELASAANRAPAATSALELVPNGAGAPSERTAVPTPQRRQPPQLVQVARRAPQMAEAPAPSEEPVDEATLGEALAAEPAPAEGEATDAPAEAPEVLVGFDPTSAGIGAGRPRDPGGFGDAGEGSGGAVVRGGRVEGEVDDCRIHGPGGIGGIGGILIGGRGHPRGGPVYLPNPRPVRQPPMIGGSTGGRSRVGATGATVRGRGGSSGASMIGASRGAPSGRATMAGGGSGPRRRN